MLIVDLFVSFAMHIFIVIDCTVRVLVFVYLNYGIIIDVYLCSYM